jgi:hypothetical protein
VPAPNSKGVALAELQARLQQAGLDAEIVTRRALEAIRADELYVFTHPAMHDEVKDRFTAIVAAMDRAVATA